MQKNKPTIVFVYNADSGVVSMVKDYWHKILKPSTYECNLCAVTFGNLGIKNDWKEFIDGLGYPVEFLHRDEFYEKYKMKDVKFPVAFLNQEGKLKEFISTGEINAVKSLEDLIVLVSKKVKMIT